MASMLRPPRGAATTHLDLDESSAEFGRDLPGKASCWLSVACDRTQEIVGLAFSNKAP